MIKRGRKAIYSFKNMTNTMIYPVSDPGIYHHEGFGLISISGDGSNWITITDKNLGATQVWNTGDNLSESNCGYYYQRGNNYGFPRDSGAVLTTSNIQVDTTGYGPGNYYSSSTFITEHGEWSNPSNDNLRGGETGTVEAMQGPCDNGYHIPSSQEQVDLCGILITTFGLPDNGLTVRDYLKMPFAGDRLDWNAVVTNQGNSGHYLSSTPISSGRTPYLYEISYRLNSALLGSRANGYSIRPFKNIPVQPDTLRTVLYQPN